MVHLYSVDDMTISLPVYQGITTMDILLSSHQIHCRSGADVAPTQYFECTTYIHSFDCMRART